MRQLSLELLELIAENTSSTRDIAQLALVNHQCHAAAIRALFHTMAIHSPQQYAALVRHTKRFKEQGWLNYVRRVDLSSYTARGSGWSEAQAKAIVEPEGLAYLLSSCVNMTQLYVGEEMMQAFVEPVVIRAVFNGHLRLEVLDFTGFCDRKFTAAMAEVFAEDKDKKNNEEEMSTMEQQPPAATTTTAVPTVMPPRLGNISFYMCMALSQASFFVPFFKQMRSNGNALHRLDLGHTKVTSDLFQHLNPDSMTHLNLQGCHGIRCCSAVIPFLSRARAHLVELNLNMNFNGVASNNFCRECLSHLVATEMPSLRSLNLGGHASMDDTVLASFSPVNLKKIEYLSLASSQHITTDGLMTLLGKMPNLKYLNLSRTWFALDLKYMVAILQNIVGSSPVSLCGGEGVQQQQPQQKLYKALKVVEISQSTTGSSSNKNRLPEQFQGWSLVHHGRRSYYSRDNVDPRFFYANKLPLRDEFPCSPMTKYWSYSC